jgi:phosphoglycolate phosphatase-like HAD superfamily hydrolase
VAHAEIAAIEAQALRDMQLMPGALELSRFLDERGVPRALVTRNVNGALRSLHLQRGRQCNSSFPRGRHLLVQSMPVFFLLRAASVEFFHKHHFTLPPFMPAMSREFAPYKPDPASLLHIAEKWSVQPTELVMVGDSAKDDVSEQPNWHGTWHW